MIEILNSNGLFIFFSIIGVLSSIIILWRMSQRNTLSVDIQSDFVVMPKTSSIINNLDPRGEDINK